MKRAENNQGVAPGGGVVTHEAHAYIQLNSTCNQKCLFCNRPPQDQTGDFTRFIPKPKDVMRAVKDKLKDPEMKRIIFTGGEPLLYPEISKVIRFAKKCGFMVEIQTNGTLLDKQMISTLKNAGLDIINFGLHSHKKNVSNQLRGVQFGFDTIIKNLRLADKNGFKIHVIHVINSFNYKDLPGFIDFMHKLRLHNLWLNLSLVVPEGWAWENKQVIPRPGEVKPFLQRAMKKCVKYGIPFDVSEIVPLCIVNGFENHAISTVFNITKFRIVDDYLSGVRSLDFSKPSSLQAAKAPQCKKCTMNEVCAGFYPRLKELYGVSDFIPRTDDPLPVYKKLRLI